MAERPTIVSKLKNKAPLHGILLHRRRGRNIRERINEARDAYNQERTLLLEHEYPLHYRLLVSGSARISPDSPEYTFTEQLTESLVSTIGVDIITGAGPGIMGAAVLGSKEAKDKAKENGQKINSRNIGIGIQLPWEEDKPFLDTYNEHLEMSTRLQELIDMSHASYFGPGGIGTALELLMILQLKQAKHLEVDYPIIIHPFWKPFLSLLKRMTYTNRFIQGTDTLAKKEDFQVTYSDNIPEIVDIITANYNAWYENIGQHARRSIVQIWKHNREAKKRC